MWKTLKEENKKEWNIYITQQWITLVQKEKLTLLDINNKPKACFANSKSDSSTNLKMLNPKAESVLPQIHQYPQSWLSKLGQ